MRARTQWKTRIPNDHLPVVLDVLGWMPNQPQSSHDVESHKERILATIPEPKKTQVRSSHVLTVYRARTNTWGIVSREQPDVLTFRIESDDSADVHKATEDLCESLVLDYRKHWRVRDHQFHALGTLQILEKDGEKVIHDGKFVRGRLQRALAERQLEAFAGLFLVVLSVWCFWLSRPSQLIDQSTLAGQQLRWQFEVWGRLGTAFAASSVTAIVYILFTLLSIGRHRHVVWNPPNRK